MNEIKIFDYSEYSVETTEILEGIEQAVKSRTAQTVIDNGRDLIRAKKHLKAVYGHGHFQKWVEDVFGMTKQRASEYMQIATAFKSPDFGLTDAFKKSALVLLSSPSVDEVVRQNATKLAEQGEKITTVKAKELIEAEKKIALLEEQLKEKPSELIDDLKKLLDSGDITQRMADIYAKLPRHQQFDVAAREESMQSLQHDVNTLTDSKMYLLEEEKKAREKSEMLQDKFESAVGEETSKLIEVKDLQIKKIKQEKDLLRVKIENEIRKEVELDLEKRITKSEVKADEKNQEASEYKKLLKSSNASVHTLSSENDKLKEQIELSNPSNIDNALAREILKEREMFEYTMKFKIADILKYGASTDDAVNEFEIFIELISSMIAKLKQNCIVEV